MKLEMKDVMKYYGKKQALNKVSMEFEAGIYGLLGPNGAGKSTLMNIIVGNLRPNAGKILYDGKEIDVIGNRFRKWIGYMPQQQGMYEYFTGYRFLSYMAALKGMNAEIAAHQIQTVAKQVNLEEQLGSKIGGYSGGMKQRLLIAQAILDDPEIIVLDEPTAGLDPKERIRIRNLISEIAMNKIVIIATHVVQDIEYIAKEIILLKNGELIVKCSSEKFVNEINGKVYEIVCQPQQVNQVIRGYTTSNIVKEGNQVIVRVISDKKPDSYECRVVTPSLEDRYLYEFGDEKFFR